MLSKVSLMLLLVVACGGGVQVVPQPDRRVLVMQPGEGPGDRADVIAEQMIGPAPGGQAPSVISADLVASITLPGRSIEFVISHVRVQGRNSQCLVMWSEIPGPSGTSTNGSSHCDEALPEVEPGVVLDNSAGNVDEGVRSLLLLVSAETVSVQVNTTTGLTYSVLPVAGIAYVEWPADRGEGLRVVGLDADGAEIWSQDLPFDVSLNRLRVGREGYVANRN